MSGCGRSGQGGRGNHYGGRSGRGLGRSNKRSKSSTNPSGKGKEEMKFVLKYSGKQQIVTYDTLKDNLIKKIQKNINMKVALPNH